MKKILGISALYHDSAATLVVDGKIIAAAQEERFTRKKNDADFPVNAVKFCLEFAGMELRELDAIVFYDKPLLKFERLLETYYGFAPRGLISFLKAIPVWLSEKLFIKRIISEHLTKIGNFDKKKLKILFAEHHLSHGASAFFPSPFQEAAILNIDAVGEWCTASIGIGKGNKITMLREMNFPHSVGLLYSAFTYFLGFEVNSGEYKLMGLAPYGNPDSDEAVQFLQAIRSEMIDIKDDGSVWLNPDYFRYATGLRMTNDKKWKSLFNLNRRESTDEILQSHCNLAWAIQNITEEIVLKMAIEAKRLTGCDNLCLAGGVGLNCVANGKLIKAGIFKNVFIQPAAGDAGGSLGAALATHFIYYGSQRQSDERNDQLEGSYLGPEYSAKDVESICRRANAPFIKFDNFEELVKTVADKIASGNVIGWFQGRMEFGPRALGNRSILADAGNPDMQKRLNLKIKFREGFRPFAPAVLKEDAQHYFALKTDSPYMLVVAPLNEEHREMVPQKYNELPLFEKLYCRRSKWQSVTHVDFSARIQTVSAETNKKFYQLICAIKERTGHGIVLNTSFNVGNEPIVCSPEDACTCFMNTGMDFLVMNNYLLSKADQSERKNVY